jgi:protein-tyrosine phosphatase
MTKRVLFVCMGNICRSPAGQAVMQRFAEEYRLDVEIDSAGTHRHHIGEPVDVRMREAAASRGYELAGRARQVAPGDLEPGAFDLVLAMDTQNYSFLRSMISSPSSHIRLFGDYLDDDWPKDVPDPYYGEITRASIRSSICSRRVVR